MSDPPTEGRNHPWDSEPDVRGQREAKLSAELRKIVSDTSSRGRSSSFLLLVGVTLRVRRRPPRRRPAASTQSGTTTATRSPDEKATANDAKGHLATAGTQNFEGMELSDGDGAARADPTPAALPLRPSLIYGTGRHRDLSRDTRRVSLSAL